MSLTVDIISDVICPWCYVGKRRLEKAMAALDGSQPVRVRWLPFQLNPQMPKEGISRKEYRIRKFGSWERSMELDAQVVAAGKAEGIHFAFDRIERTPNTLDAHRMIELADSEKIQDAVVEGLFQAYFTDGRDLSNSQTLVDIVVACGLERQKAESILNSPGRSAAFQETERLARRFQLEGVPFFIIQDKVTLSGAQPAAVIQAGLEEAKGECERKQT